MGVRECANRDEHDSVVALFRVEHIAPADRAKPEPELRSLITGTNKFGGRAGHRVGHGISGKCGKNATGSLLTSKAVTNTAAQGFSVNFDAELPTKAGCCFGRHENLEEMLDLLLSVQALRSEMMTCPVFV
jgi:hypothetical protein